MWSLYQISLVMKERKPITKERKMANGRMTKVQVARELGIDMDQALVGPRSITGATIGNLIVRGRRSGRGRDSDGKIDPKKYHSKRGSVKN